MTKDDLIFILNTAADLSGHQNNGWAALSRAQDAVKAYVADKEELQDPAMLTAVDRLLKLSSAAQVPGVFKTPDFDLTDYVEPKEETPSEETATIEQPEWMNQPRFTAGTEEPVATTPDDAPEPEPSPELPLTETPVETEEPKE